MMINKVSAIYFSPTGNSKKTACAMAEAVAKRNGISKAEEIDFTCVPSNEKFDTHDFVIFAVPVYAGRVPNVARFRLKNFKGKDTPCVIVASYGNREFDDALLEMADILSEQGFVIKGAAGVIGRHTYGEIQVGRPNDDDLAECRQFALMACENDKIWPEFDIPGNRPYREGMSKGSHHPTSNDSCIKCGLCARACPVQAMDDDCETVSDNCISCFRCIRNCPVGGKEIVTEAYIKFAADFTEKLKERKENRFFL